MNRQPQLNEDIDTHTNIPLIPTGSIAVVQREDSRVWMHGTIGGHRTEDHNRRIYKMRVTKTRHTITRTRRNMKAMPISAEDYTSNEMSKDNRSQTDDKHNKHVDHVTITGWLSYEKF